MVILIREIHHQAIIFSRAIIIIITAAIITIAMATITITTTATITTTTTTTLMLLKLAPTVSPVTTQPTHPDYYNKSIQNGNPHN